MAKPRPVQERRRVEPLSAEAFGRFAGGVCERLEKLELHSDRVQIALFVGTDDRPSLNDLMKTIDAHIKAMCGWAVLARRVTIIVSSVCVAIAAVLAAFTALGIRVF